MNIHKPHSESGSSSFSLHPSHPNNSPPCMTLQSHNNNKLSQISLVPLESIYLSRNVSHFSDYGLSFTTEQIVHSNRVSMVSEETIEGNYPQFRFENKVQNSLKLMNFHQKFCITCNTNTYFSERYELQKLNFLQFIKYWFQSLKCCSEPKTVGKYHMKIFYCIYCGSRQEFN